MLGMSLSFYMPSYFGINYDALFARHTSYNNSDNSDVKKALQLKQMVYYVKYKKHIVSETF